MKLEFTVRNKRLSCKSGGPLVGDTVGHYTVSFQFDQEWDGLVKVVAFRNGADTASLIYTGACPLPPQVSGRGELQVACHGYRKEGDQVAVVRTFRMARPLRLLAAGPMAEDNTEAFTPTLFSQVMAAAGEALDAAGQVEQIKQELQQQKDRGDFDGGYYIPWAGLADDQTMELAFTGSEPGMEPLQFRIPLPKAEETAQTVDAIPVPETAEVGQTIRVAAVDETGKPTDWEAADFPGGNAGSGWTLSADFVSEEDVAYIALPMPTEVNEAYAYFVIPAGEGTVTLWARAWAANGALTGSSGECGLGTMPSSETHRSAWFFRFGDKMKALQSLNYNYPINGSHIQYGGRLCDVGGEYFVLSTQYGNGRIPAGTSIKIYTR